MNPNWANGLATLRPRKSILGQMVSVLSAPK